MNFDITQIARLQAQYAQPSQPAAPALPPPDKPQPRTIVQQLAYSGGNTQTPHSTTWQVVKISAIALAVLVFAAAVAWEIHFIQSETAPRDVQPPPLSNAPVHKPNISVLAPQASLQPQGQVQPTQPAMAAAPATETSSTASQPTPDPVQAQVVAATQRAAVGQAESPIQRAPQQLVTPQPAPQPSSHIVHREAEAQQPMVHSSRLPVHLGEHIEANSRHDDRLSNAQTSPTPNTSLPQVSQAPAPAPIQGVTVNGVPANNSGEVKLW